MRVHFENSFRAEREAHNTTKRSFRDYCLFAQRHACGLGFHWKQASANLQADLAETQRQLREEKSKALLGRPGARVGGLQ